MLLRHTNLSCRGTKRIFCPPHFCRISASDRVVKIANSREQGCPRRNPANYRPPRPRPPRPTSTVMTISDNPRPTFKTIGNWGCSSRRRIAMPRPREVLVAETPLLFGRRNSSVDPAPCACRAPCVAKRCIPRRRRWVLRRPKDAGTGPHWNRSKSAEVDVTLGASCDSCRRPHNNNVP